MHVCKYIQVWVLYHRNANTLTHSRPPSISLSDFLPPPPLPHHHEWRLKGSHRSKRTQLGLIPALDGKRWYPPSAMRRWVQESCHTCVCIRRTYACVRHAYAWVMSHTCHTHDCVMSHMNESRRTYECVMSHVWMCHVTHTSESCHTYKWALVNEPARHMNQPCHSWGVMYDESCHTHWWMDPLLLNNSLRLEASIKPVYVQGGGTVFSSRF